MYYSCSRWKTNLSNCGASRYLSFSHGVRGQQKSHVSYRNLFQTAALTSVYGTFLLPICPLPAPSFSLVRPFFDDDGKPNAALLYGHKYFIMNFSLPLSLSFFSFFDAFGNAFAYARSNFASFVSLGSLSRTWPK